MGYSYLSGKKLQGVAANKIIKLVEESTGIKYDSQPNWFHKGMLLKKYLVKKEVMNEYTNGPVVVERPQVVDATSILEAHIPENLDAFENPFLPTELCTNPIPEDYSYIHK